MAKYNAKEVVRKFIEEFGYLGEFYLRSFNEIDPLHIFYGEDINPDEYVGMVKRLIKQYRYNPHEGLDDILGDAPVSSEERQRLKELLTDDCAWDPIFNERSDDD